MPTLDEEWEYANRILDSLPEDVALRIIRKAFTDGHLKLNQEYKRDPEKQEVK